jgi:predicted nucleotidyltransferase
LEVRRGRFFRLAVEAKRISIAYLFDPLTVKFSYTVFESEERLAERDNRFGRTVTNEAGERLFLYKGRTLDEWLPEVVERIVERFDPLRVILFGSLARGEANYDSDIDLFVVFDEVEWENKRKLTVEIRSSIADLAVPVDVIIADLDEIRRRGKIVGTVPHAALHEGKVLYDRP